MITEIVLLLLLGALAFFSIYKQREHFGPALLNNPCVPCGDIGGESCPSKDAQGNTIWSACPCMTPDGHAGNTCDGRVCSSSITMCKSQPLYTNPHPSIALRDLNGDL